MLLEQAIRKFSDVRDAFEPALVDHPDGGAFGFVAKLIAFLVLSDPVTQRWEWLTGRTAKPEKPGYLERLGIKLHPDNAAGRFFAQPDVNFLPSRLGTRETGFELDVAFDASRF